MKGAGDLGFFGALHVSMELLVLPHVSAPLWRFDLYGNTPDSEQRPVIQTCLERDLGAWDCRGSGKGVVGRGHLLLPVPQGSGCLPPPSPGALPGHYQGQEQHTGEVGTWEGREWKFLCPKGRLEAG